MTKRYGVLYGVVGSPDTDIDGPYATPDAARAAYDPARRVVHVARGRGRILAGADLVELEPGEPLCPKVTVEEIQAEEPRYCER